MNKKFSQKPLKLVSTPYERDQKSPMDWKTFKKIHHIKVVTDKCYVCGEFVSGFITHYFGKGFHEGPTGTYEFCQKHYKEMIKTAREAIKSVENDW